MKEIEEHQECLLENELEHLSIKAKDDRKLLDPIQSIILNQSLYSKALITSVEELEKKLGNDQDDLGKVFQKLFESIDIDLETKNYTINQPKLKHLVSLIDGLLDFNLSFEGENGLNDEMRSMLLYRLSSWYTYEDIDELWILDDMTRQALKSTIDKLWKVKDHQTSNEKDTQDQQNETCRSILSKYIKPIFIDTDQSSRVSKQINIKTGRKKQNKSNGFQDELFGPSALIGNQSNYKSNQYLGFWNSICIIINQLSSVLSSIFLSFRFCLFSCFQKLTKFICVESR